MSARKSIDLIAGLSFVGLALLVIFVLIPIGVDAPKKVKFAALHPAYYPRIVGYCLLLIGAALLLTRTFTRSHSQPQTIAEKNAPDTEQDEARPLTKTLFLLGTVLVILLVYFWLLPTLGFVLLSMLVLMILMMLAGERNVVVLLAVSIGVPSCLYLFFAKVANIPIPTGVLQPWLVG